MRLSYLILIIVGLLAGKAADARATQQGGYYLAYGDAKFCNNFVDFANGKASAVKIARWLSYDEAYARLSGQARKSMTRLHRANGDLFLVYNVENDNISQEREIIFVKTKKSNYDYRLNLIYVMGYEGRGICFVNGIINQNLYCQDYLHEQLPENCSKCDSSYKFLPNWRLESDIILYNSTYYYVDRIKNGPYYVVWGSPPEYKYKDESISLEPTYKCILKL